jgi:6-phosphogluconolactonase
MSKPKSFTGAGCNTNFSTRWFVAALVLLTVIIAAVPAAQSTEASSGKYFVYVGTYTKKDSKGIYAYRFDAVTGETTPVGLVAETENPSFLAAHPGGRFLYAVNEIDKFNGQASGAVSAYSIDRKTGGLSLLNQVPSMGAGPAHLSLDKTGKYLLIANYGGGSVAAFPVAKDGWVGKPSGFVQHTGSSVNPDRQTSPHAHAIVVSNDNRFAVVADLGLDELLVYKFDAAKGSLTPNDPKFAKTDPGAGPRHLAFHPNNKFVYVVNEMQSTVSAFSYDGQAGKLHSLQRLSTLPKDYTGQNSTAEIWIGMASSSISPIVGTTASPSSPSTPATELCRPSRMSPRAAERRATLRLTRPARGCLWQIRNQTISFSSASIPTPAVSPRPSRCCKRPRLSA